MSLLIELTKEQFDTILNSLSIEQAKTVVKLLNERIEKDKLSKSRMPIQELNLSVRAYHALEALNINSVNEIDDELIKRLRNTKGVGEQTITDIKNALAEVFPDSYK